MLFILVPDTECTSHLLGCFGVAIMVAWNGQLQAKQSLRRIAITTKAAERRPGIELRKSCHTIPKSSIALEIQKEGALHVQETGNDAITYT